MVNFCDYCYDKSVGNQDNCEYCNYNENINETKDVFYCEGCRYFEDKNNKYYCTYYFEKKLEINPELIIICDNYE